MKRKILHPDTKRFTAQDMLRFARYLSDGRYSEHELKLKFASWFRGPENARPGIDWDMPKRKST